MDPSPGDLVEIFADNCYGGVGLVIEVRNMYVLVKATDSLPLWYTRNEIAHLHATHIGGDWLAP